MSSEEENEEPIIIDDIGDWYKMEKINMIFEVFNQNSKYYREMMNIIVAAKVNPPEKGQLHHIIPRCWFKHYNMEVDNSISNTVLLSWEDHKKVHTLAYKCAKEQWFKTKMSCAAHLMGDKAAVMKHSEETKKKMSKTRKGRKLTEEWKNKISKTLIGKPHIQPNGYKISKKGRENMSESHKGVFGKKYKEKYGMNRIDNIKMYDKEYRFYKKYGKCRWE